MTKKVLYFTVGPLPTGGEAADIAKLNAAAALPYEVGVRSNAGSSQYGFGPEKTDFVAGTPPNDYANTTQYPRMDVNNIPAQTLTATQAVVANGQSVTVGGVTYTFTVVAGVITAINHT